VPNRSKNLKKILTQIQSEEMIGLWEKYSVEVTWGGGGGRGHGGEIPPPPPSIDQTRPTVRRRRSVINIYQDDNITS
jgi:hypothetical protein